MKIILLAALVLSAGCGCRRPIKIKLVPPKDFGNCDYESIPNLVTCTNYTKQEATQ